MKQFFNINYEFDRNQVHHSIEERLKHDGSDYICVADGVIMEIVNRNPDYCKVINDGMFAICDSGYVPLYIKWIYGERYEQYSGSQIFEDIIRSGKYRMIFLGSQQATLDGLRNHISEWNPKVKGMKFIELPFRPVEEFDYPQIAQIIMEDHPDIVWVSLGAPKQEFFMHRLRPHLDHGVMIAVGAAFKFFSGVDAKRAPQWMIRHHMEFIYRLFREPKKQFNRCYHILYSLPHLLLKESQHR